MKKGIALILAFVLILSTVFVACSSNETDEQDTTEGLEQADNEYGFETVEVTDDDGKTVTDKNGDAVTTEVNVEYVTDKNGKTIAKQIDDDGEPVTDKKGKEVTVETDYSVTTTKKSSSDDDEPASTVKTTASKSTTKPTKKNEQTTEKEYTTIETDKDKVPETSDDGSEASFSQEDQEIIKSLLEVPYLYLESYENSDGVPTEIATHVAIWMAQREELSTSTYASGTIVLDLFKYFGQTVVNFKSNCNGVENENITYSASNDTFKIKSFEEQTHTVKLTSIQDLGNNNYYKVVADVSGTNKAKKVVAIVQKNKLESSLGFSIKALKWSK